MIYFTHHAREKFDVLKRHGMEITQERVENTISDPETVQTEEQFPLIRAEKKLDQDTALRVLYKKEGNMHTVLTFYPIKKNHSLVI